MMTIGEDITQEFMLGDEYIEFDEELLPLELNVLEIETNDHFRYDNCCDETEVDLTNMDTNVTDES